MTTTLQSIAEIKDAAQMLDTVAVQWFNSGPPENIRAKLNEARELLQRGVELAEAPLRIALVGEFNSGKTLLLNSLLDSADLFPCLLQPTTGNVLEVKVQLRKEERAPAIRSATISFFNQFEIENILDFYLRQLKNQGIEGLPAKITVRDLEKLERLLIKKFQELKSITPKYTIIATLDFIIGLRCNLELVMREDRFSCSLPVDLISAALTLSARPELNIGIQSIVNTFKQIYAPNEGKPAIEKVTSKNLRTVFSMVRRVAVEVSAWCVPFGIKDPDQCSHLAFLDFPGLGAESSSARDEYLCMSEIRDAHAVLVIFNGSNPGTSGASVMATLFQRAGKLTTERTIVAVNRFDEFHPLPTGETVESYYAKSQEGTTVGFSTIMVPAKNLVSSGSMKKFNIYLCSALCYLFDEKTARPNWSFGNPQWFNDNKRQAAYTLYKRSQEDFLKLIKGVESNKAIGRDHQIMREGLERYLDKGGVPSLRQDLVKYAMDKGERLIREDAMKEIRAASKILDELAPAMQQDETTGSINPEVNYAAQEMYRVIELAVADTLPNGPSEYRTLRIRGIDRDIPLWELIEEEIATRVTSWPEWFAILNRGGATTKGPAPVERPGKAKKGFDRYAGIRGKQMGATVPTEFNAFNERFHATSIELREQTLEYIRKAMAYSLQRFEGHPDYREAIEHFQRMVRVDKLPNIDEALPLLDIWNPSQMAEEEIIPTVLERIEDELKAIEDLSYPYDGSKPCFWNIALIIRIQVQLVKTYRDKLSRMVAAAENEFQNFFCNEILRAEILPLVRSALNNPEFLGDVAMAEGFSSWEVVGQVVRSAVEKFKQLDGSGAGGPLPVKPKIAPSAALGLGAAKPSAKPKAEETEDVPEDDAPQAEDAPDMGEAPEEGVEFDDQETAEPEPEEKAEGGKKKKEEEDFEEW